MVELSLEELEVIGHSSSIQESGTSPFEEKNQETCSPTKDDTDTVETPYIEMIFGKSEETKSYYQSYGEATKWACVASRTPATYKMFLDGLRELGLKVSQFTPGKVVDDDAPSKSSVPRDDPSLPQVVLLDLNVSVTK
ncbi:hypothetical protein IFM89_004299, partial [Coptis chinensis]